MEEADKKSESEPESECKKQIMKLEKRLIRLERILDALNARMEGAGRHIADEGWFE